jgi:cysteine desulfurase
LDELIYLDYQATTPCDARVVAAMAPFWSDGFGNAASRTHAAGWAAGEAVETARRQVAALVAADARAVIFTSGATEANNLAILGAARGAADRSRDQVVVAATEHKAVLDPADWLGREGFRVTRVGVGCDGRLDLDALEQVLDERTLLVSVMHANNEIGVVQDIAEVARLAHGSGALVHTDAAQSAGKLPLDVDALGIDLLSVSAHKLYGPKGVGALIVRRRRPPLRLAPLLHGGGHERGLRSGTLPVPLCVGFGLACEIAGAELREEAARVRALRERLWTGLCERVPGVSLNGHPELRLPGNLNVRFPVEGEALLAATPELALSAGSACTSAVRQPSHVLRALGLDEAEALASLRLSIGRPTTRAEVDRAVELIATQVARLRSF